MFEGRLIDIVIAKNNGYLYNNNKLIRKIVNMILVHQMNFINFFYFYFHSSLKYIFCSIFS